MAISKRQKRSEWIKQHSEAIKLARLKYVCPENCKAQCRNGRTCFTSSSGGWGYWAQAFDIAEVNCEKINYWSGSNPTPSTAINRGIAEYIRKNAPKELL